MQSIKAKGRSMGKPKLAKRAQSEPTDPKPDFSGIDVDLDSMRELKSDAARAVYAAARNTPGSAKTLSQKRSDIFYVNPYDLHIKPGWNVREMASHLVLSQIDWLATDIAKKGVEEPYSVYLENGRLYIANGHLRQHAVFHAINNLGAEIRTVPVKMGPAGENEQDRALKQVRTNSGLRLSPWEQGLLMKRFIGWGWNNPKIADNFGCSVGHVHQMLALQAIPREMAEYVSSGTIASHYAKKALKGAKGNVTKAVSEVEGAIKKKMKTGASKVMPKHGKMAAAPAPVAKPGAAQKKLDAIGHILRNVSVRADGEGRWLISLTIEEGERLAKLTGMETPAE